MSEFAGLVAVVTGGASGIGAAVAKRLHDGGARVAILDREIRGASGEGAQGASAEAPVGAVGATGAGGVAATGPDSPGQSPAGASAEAPGRATPGASASAEAPAGDPGSGNMPGEATTTWLALRADVTDQTSVSSAVEHVHATWGGIDIVVNNAGIGAQGTVADGSEEQWHQVLDVNLMGMVRTSRAALPYLHRSESAAIVNVSSIAATAGLPQRALYSASKGAVLALTRAMAADHIREGIRVNCVSPGTVNTPWINRLLAAAEDPAAERAALEARQPHGRLVEPKEVAEAVAYLAGPRNASTAGLTLAVDGGMDALRVRPQ